MTSVKEVLEVVEVTGWDRLSPMDANYHAYHLHRAMQEYAINNSLRIAAFLAQLAHETGGWHWMRELGGPTYFQKYDGRKDLGNTNPGDGYRYRGRGYLMLTGRHNYREMGIKLNLPLEEQPDLALLPAIAARIAGQYWQDKELNPLADEGKFKTITLLINGGLNGWEDRKAKYATAMRLLK